jgi:hypothetical protein
MGSVALAAIFGGQMHFLFLARYNHRPHFLVALLETQLDSRGLEQFFCLACMRAVTGKTFTFGNRLMGIFPGQHWLFIMAFIAHISCGSLAYLIGFFRSMRIMAPQALSLRNRVVQHGPGGIYASMTHKAQLDFGFQEFEFVLGSGKRCVAHRALPYFQRAVQILMFHDLGVALAGNAAPGGIGMLFFLGERIAGRIQDRTKQEQNRSGWKCECIRPEIRDHISSVSGMPIIALKHGSQFLTFLYAP